MTRASILAIVLGTLATLTSASQHVIPEAHYELELQLNPDAGRLEGRAHIRARESGDYVLRLDRRFALNDTPSDFDAPREAPRERYWTLYLAAGETLSVSWHGEPGTTADPVGITPEGSFLPGGMAWYPRLERTDDHPLLHAWSVQLTLPRGQQALVSGELHDTRETEQDWQAGFVFRYPGRGIDLFAGPYEVSEHAIDSIDGRRIKLRTWFHPGLEELAEPYLKAAADFIRRHEQEIGAYPFGDFAIVSSPHPTGRGMPGATYLGIEVLRLPFIRATSLGHEVLHNWWGNGVYPDYTQGNWSEGLTTWMADHAYARERDPEQARAMRENWMRELSALPPDARLPIRAFTSPHHDVAHVAGYGKTALFFALLEDTLGQDVFRAAVRELWRERRFRVTGWDAIQQHFEHAAERPLDALFEAWLERSGLPEIDLVSAEWDERGGKLMVELVQASPPWPLDVPLGIETASGTRIERVRLEAEQARHTLALPEAPHRVVLDPERMLPRRLAPEDAPPLLRELRLAGQSGLIVLEPALTEAAQGVARALAGRDIETITDSAPTDDARPLIVVGTHAAINAWRSARRLATDVAPPEAGGDVRVWTQRADSAAVAFIVTDDAAALAASARALPHHGNRSWLVFEQGRVSARGTWPLTETAIEFDRPAR